MHEVIDTPFICGHGCKDWELEVSADERIKLMKEGTKDGVLYLLHVMEGNTNTLKALETFIPELLSQGYTFVTVPEMFKIKGISTQGHSGNLYTFC